jgi:hypothetical protein
VWQERVQRARHIREEEERLLAALKRVNVGIRTRPWAPLSGPPAASPEVSDFAQLISDVCQAQCFSSAAGHLSVIEPDLCGWIAGVGIYPAAARMRMVAWQELLCVSCLDAWSKGIADVL